VDTCDDTGDDTRPQARPELSRGCVRLTLFVI
jgi:hypothetical protein